MRYLAGPSADEEGLRVLAVEHGTSLKEARTRLSLRLLARVIRKVAGVTKVTIEFEKGEALVEGPPRGPCGPRETKGPPVTVVYLQPSEELALLHVLDRLPRTADPAFREIVSSSIRKVLGVSWLGQKRHYYLDRAWAYDTTAGLWIASGTREKPLRAKVKTHGRGRFFARKTGSLELWGSADFPPTLYVVTAGREDPQIMKRPMDEAFAVPTTDLELFEG
jgi:hypothetical protein